MFLLVAFKCPDARKRALRTLKVNLCSSYSLHVAVMGYLNWPSDSALLTQKADPVLSSVSPCYQNRFPHALISSHICFGLLVSCLSATEHHSQVSSTHLSFGCPRFISSPWTLAVPIEFFVVFLSPSWHAGTAPQIMPHWPLSSRSQVQCSLIPSFGSI
jgi:hypothetical protein